MRKQHAFVNVILKRFVRANRMPAVHSPLILPISKLGWQESGQALNAFKRTKHGGVSLRGALLAITALFLLFFALALSAQAAVREVSVIALTVGDLDRELMFFTNILPFELVSISEASGR